MNWDAIGAIGEIVGALAVVVSLMYLALQIRSSNKIAVRDTELELHGISSEVNKSARKYSKLLLKLEERESGLTPEEEIQAKFLLLEYLNLYSAVNSGMRNGLISKGLFNAYMHDLESMLTEYPGFLSASRKYFLPRYKHVQSGDSVVQDKVRELAEKEPERDSETIKTTG